MNRYEEEYLEDIPEVNPYLGSNIKVLREEARLKEQDLAEALSVSVEEIKSFEKGTKVPTKDQVLKILPLLRIGHYDIMTRNILEERNNALKAMRNSKERNNYNWYFGDRSVVILNILYLILIPLVFLILAFPLRSFVSFINFYIGEYAIISKETPILQAYTVVSFISGVLIVINFLKSINYVFRLWHIIWLSLLLTICVFIGLIGTIPYYIYIVVRLIVLRGRNHL